MNRCPIRCCACLGGIVLVLLSAPGRGAVPSVAGGDTALKEALPVLQADFVDYDNLGLLPTDRLSDVVARAQGEMSVRAHAASPGKAVVPMTCVALPGGPVYLRLASFPTGAGWPDLVAKLNAAFDQGAQGVILDLRSTASPDDFEGAARAAGLFVPAGTPLFTITDSRREAHAFASVEPDGKAAHSNGPVVVLINGRTAGAGEALAAVLKAHGALTLGGQSSGNGAEFAEHALGSGQVLRYLSGQVTMADGSLLWHHPVDPDVGLPVEAGKETAALELIDQGRILDVIQEGARSHRLSEAALVKGEDPGVEAYLTSPGKAACPAATPDSTLIAALDSLKAIRVSQAASTVAGKADAKTPQSVQ